MNSRFYLSGDKKGNREVFADLPGYSDTIRMTDHETLLVPMALTRYMKYGSVLDITGRYPLIRTFLGFVSLTKVNLYV